MILHSFHYFISLSLITVKNYPWLHPLHSFSRHPAVVPTVSNRSDSCFHGKAASSGVAFVAPPDAVWQLATASLSLRPGCKNERASNVFCFVVRILKHHFEMSTKRLCLEIQLLEGMKLLDAMEAPLGPIFFIFVYFLEPKWLNNRLAHPSWKSWIRHCSCLALLNDVILV